PAPPLASLFPYTTLFRSSRLPDNLFDGNQPIIDFRHLILEQSFEKYGGCPGKDNPRISVDHFHFVNNGPGAVPFSEPVFRYLFEIGKHTSELQSRENLVC